MPAAIVSSAMTVADNGGRSSVRAQRQARTSTQIIPKPPSAERYQELASLPEKLKKNDQAPSRLLTR